MEEEGICRLGVQEPPNDAMIYNRRRPDGTFRSLAGFFLLQPQYKEETMSTEQRDTTTIAGKFAEALDCLEDGLHWLQQLNEQYDAEEQGAASPKVVYSRSRFTNPALDFWLQAEMAEVSLRGILSRLQRVEPLAPKETEPLKEETR